jgi:dihydroorotase
MSSLVIAGQIFVGDKFIRGHVRVEGGIIVSVSEGKPVPADRTLELGANEGLLPAAVDGLGALRDWAEAPRDTIETATKAALAGGITVVCDQANTVPRINTSELIRKRTDFVSERSYTDFGIQSHPPLDDADLANFKDAGAFCLSVWQWDLRPWNFPHDCDDSNRKFKSYADAGLKGLITVDELALRETPLEDEAERYALEALLKRLDPEFETRIFITQPDSVDMILAARDRFPKLLIQTAPHYLFVSREAGFEKIGSAAAHSPPLRPAVEVERLQQYAREGKIDIIVSHHTPHRTVDKFSSDPIPGEFTPKRGYVSLDFAYPLCLTRLGPELACRHFAEIPARHLGLKKGLIAPGYEADFAVVEENFSTTEVNLHVTGGFSTEVWKIDPEQFYSKSQVTPFVGDRLNYRVRKTFLRGEEVFDAVTGTFKRVPVRRVE